jgi:hypothetical protein
VEHLHSLLTLKIVSFSPLIQDEAVLYCPVNHDFKAGAIMTCGDTMLLPHLYTIHRSDIRNEG